MKAVENIDLEKERAKRVLIMKTKEGLVDLVIFTFQIFTMGAMLMVQYNFLAESWLMRYELPETSFLEASVIALMCRTLRACFRSWRVESAPLCR